MNTERPLQSSALMQTYKVGFLVEQVAGHVTNYRNLLSVVESDSEIDADWHEIRYHIDGGLIERLRARLPWVPAHSAGLCRAAYETHRALRSDKYAALFCNTTVGAFFPSAFRKTPTLIDLDSTPLQIDRMRDYGSPQDTPLFAKLKWNLWRNFMHAATLVHAWSHWAKQSVIDDYQVPEERVVVNPPGVDLAFWRPNPAGVTKVERPRRVLFVGGDFRRKGGLVLIDWFKQQKPLGVELHLVTREPVPPSDNVFVYSDMQPNSASLLALYHSSDIFVLPSLAECFGIATVEAMAAGLPVITSDAGGTADIVASGRNGYIVKANDGRELGYAVMTILRDAALREQMSQESRKIAEERFDVRINARRTLDYLKRIARSRSH